MNKHEAKCSLLIVQYIKHYCCFEHYIKMGIGKGGQEGPCPSWIFTHDTIRCFSI